MSGSAVVGSAVARDGTVLRTRHWAPGEAPWARVVLVHGIAEHSGRYERTGSLLAAAGVDVTAFDLRGFGESGVREPTWVAGRSTWTTWRTVSRPPGTGCRWS